MAIDGEHIGEPEEAEMLPDEKRVIEERLDEIEDRESHLTSEEVAENLGLDTES